MQLDPSSISLLQRMSGEQDNAQLETVIELPERPVTEMQEVVESPPVAGRMTLRTSGIEQSSPNEGDDELSALSVPSPGGFFSSLNTSVARHTWNPKEPPPPTSVATEFYGLPFRKDIPPPLPTATAAKFYGVPWANDMTSRSTCAFPLALRSPHKIQ